MKGWIYVLSNPSFSDGLIKIGRSSKYPSERSKQLFETGVPEPFRLEYAALVDEHELIESSVHRKLDQCRPNKSREFFTCAIPTAIDTIRQLASIYDEEIHYKSPNEVEEEKKRRLLASKIEEVESDYEQKVARVYSDRNSKEAQLRRISKKPERLKTAGRLTWIAGLALAVPTYGLSLLPTSLYALRLKEERDEAIEEAKQADQELNGLDSQTGSKIASRKLLRDKELKYLRLKGERAKPPVKSSNISKTMPSERSREVKENSPKASDKTFSEAWKSKRARMEILHPPEGRKRLQFRPENVNKAESHPRPSPNLKARQSPPVSGKSTAIKTETSNKRTREKEPAKKGSTAAEELPSTIIIHHVEDLSKISHIDQIAFQCRRCFKINTVKKAKRFSCSHCGQKHHHKPVIDDH